MAASLPTSKVILPTHESPEPKISVCSLIILAPAGKVLEVNPSNSALFICCCGLSSKDVFGVVEQAVQNTVNDKTETREEVIKDGFMR